MCSESAKRDELRVTRQIGDQEAHQSPTYRPRNHLRGSRNQRSSPSCSNMKLNNTRPDATVPVNEGMDAPNQA
jgi:hypothetical protein